MFLVMVILFLWNCRRIFKRLLVRFGFLNRILFNVNFLCLVEELKIICMELGFLGWYILNNGRY